MAQTQMPEYAIEQTIAYCKENGFELNFQFLEHTQKSDLLWQCDVCINGCIVASATARTKKNAKRSAADRMMRLLPLKELPVYEDAQKPENARNAHWPDGNHPDRMKDEERIAAEKQIFNNLPPSGFATDRIVAMLLEKLYLSFEFKREAQALDTDDVTVSLMVEKEQVSVGCGPDEQTARREAAGKVLLRGTKANDWHLFPKVYRHMRRKNPLVRLEYEMVRRGWNFEFQDAWSSSNPSESVCIELIVNGRQYERVSGQDRKVICMKLARGFLNQTGSAKRIMHQIATKQGKELERTVVWAVQDAVCGGLMPEWLRKAELATPEQDSLGIDVVLQTDVGPLFIQLKRSEHRKEAFLKRRRSARIEVVVINSSDESFIRKRILAAAEILRKEINAKRYQPSCFPPKA